MDKEDDNTLYDKDVVTEANLRDEYYWKLVADFIGPQSGEGLDLDQGVCRNRVLIQVGLLKEDNNFPWPSIIDWLKTIFPAHKTADFRRLIERGIATTLSLLGDTRLTFLELAVNFDFVGPICDSVGIERQDLLQLSDFSERAQLIEVTNALVLELDEFIQRENLSPIVIVHWLKNFDPGFCKNGEYQKVFPGLKAKIKTLKMYCSSSETKSRRNRRYVAVETLLLSPFHLTSFEEPLEVKKRKREDQPFFKSVTIKEEPRTYEITEEQTFVTENNIQLNPSKEESCQDQDNLNNLEMVDDYDESSTLLDIAVASVHKLSNIYGGITEECKEVSLELLKNQYTQMRKEKPEVAEFDKSLAENSHRISLGTPVEFIHHNANFIAEVHKVVEEQILTLENEVIQTSGSKLGRDKLPKFHSFVNFTESATSRYIHMACALLSPRFLHNRTFLKHWLAFCNEKDNPSELMEDSTNVINNYFEASAGLIHHYKEVGPFFSDMLALENDTCPNIVLESVTTDANDSIIQCFVCVLALIYCKILGPYLRLLKSAATFTMYPTYLLWLYQRFLNWTKESSSMLEPEVGMNVFAMTPLAERTYSGVYSFCGYWPTNRDLIKASLKRVVKAITTAADNHLKDYLPGGKYSQVPLPEMSHKLSRCTFSALMVENPFQSFLGVKKQIDSDASPSGSEEEREEDANDDYEPGEVRDEHHENVEEVEKKPQPSKKHVRFPENTDMDYVIGVVKRNGGPCRTREDLEKMMLRFERIPRDEKREYIRCEALYQMMILNNSSSHLMEGGEPTKNSGRLMYALPRVKPGFSLVLAPRRQKKYPKKTAILTEMETQQPVATSSVSLQP